MSGIILAQPQDRRRDRLASLVLLRRLAAYSRWSAVSKVAVIAVAVAVTLCSEHQVTAWLLLLPALAGTALDLLAMQVTQGNPRGRLLRGYEAHLARAEGNPWLNLPAWVECVGSLSMVTAAAWAVIDLPDGVRLVYVAVATAYLGAVSCSIFDDSAWYNADVRAPQWQEIDRILCGVQACVVVLAITWSAPWAAFERIGLVAIAVSGLLVPLRAGQTQLLVADLGLVVEAERQRGTRLVIEEASRELLPVLTELRQLCADLGPAAAKVALLTESALAGIGDIPNQVAHSASAAGAAAAAGGGRPADHLGRVSGPRPDRGDPGHTRARRRRSCAGQQCDARPGRERDQCPRHPHPRRATPGRSAADDHRRR